MTDIPDRDLPEDPDTALAGEYVLRLLGPEEAAACAAREARDPDFAARVAAWRADLEPLDAAYAEAAPPAGLERRISERLFGAAEPSGLARLWRSAGLWRGVAAAAVLAAAWFAWLPTRVPAPGEAPARLVSALASADTDVELLALFEPQAAVLNINRTSGAPAPGRALELWVIEGDAAAGLARRAAGQRRWRASRCRASSPRGSGPAARSRSATRRPGGSTTGVPGPVVAAGPVSEI